MARNADPPDLDQLLTTAELADYVGVPVQTVYKWNARGVGPEPIAVGRHRRYRRADVARWIEARRKEVA